MSFRRDLLNSANIFMVTKRISLYIFHVLKNAYEIKYGRAVNPISLDQIETLTSNIFLHIDICTFDSLTRPNKKFIRTSPPPKKMFIFATKSGYLGFSHDTAPFFENKSINSERAEHMKFLCVVRGALITFRCPRQRIPPASTEEEVHVPEEWLRRDLNSRGRVALGDNLPLGGRRTQPPRPSVPGPRRTSEIYFQGIILARCRIIPAATHSRKVAPWNGRILLNYLMESLGLFYIQIHNHYFHISTIENSMCCLSILFKYVREFYGWKTWGSF